MADVVSRREADTQVIRNRILTVLFFDERLLGEIKAKLIGTTGSDRCKYMKC
jgi:hypothetical protein